MSYRSTYQTALPPHHAPVAYHTRQHGAELHRKAVGVRIGLLHELAQHGVLPFLTYAGPTHLPSDLPR